MNISDDYQRVLVISTEPNSPHFETSLEIAANLAIDGRDVHHEYVYAPYHEFLKAPNKNNIKRWVTTGQKIAQRTAGINLSIGWQYLNHSPQESLPLATLADFGSWKEFHDLGDAVRSSASSRFGSLCIDEAGHKVEISQMITSGVLVYEASLNLLEEMTPDLVVFFNGRFVNSRAVWRASEALKIHWASHERGGQDGRYFFDIQTTVHNMATFRAMARKYASSRVRELGTRCSAIDPEVYAESLRRASTFSWTEYVGPEIDVVYFASSLTEYLYTGYEYFGLWKTEQGAFRALAEACFDQGRRLALRLHPNMQRYGECEVRVWESVLADFPWVTVIRPDDQTSSYDILQSAEAVATGFSTVGVEAALRGKPVAVFAAAPYAEALQAVECQTSDQIVEFLKCGTASSRSGAVMYLEFLAQYGHTYAHYDAETPHTGRFAGASLPSAGKAVQSRPLRRLLNVCRRGN